MSEEDAPTVISVEPGSRSEVSADPADDWLSDASELEGVQSELRRRVARRLREQSLL